MPTFLRLLACRLRIKIRSALTREYLWGELRNGDRPTGQQIGDHIRKMCAALPPCVKQIFGRADAGFYCGEAVEA